MTTWIARHADGRRCLRATSTYDCPRTHTYVDESPAAVDAAVRDVARMLPFSVELEADMGGTFALQISLGRRGADVDDPTDRAGIEGETDDEPQWWFDVDGGARTFLSGMGLLAEPASVARWFG